MEEWSGFRPEDLDKDVLLRQWVPVPEPLFDATSLLQPQHVCTEKFQFGLHIAQGCEHLDLEAIAKVVVEEAVGVEFI